MPLGPRRQSAQITEWINTILKPTIAGLHRYPLYRGLYAGLMLTSSGPKVLNLTVGSDPKHKPSSLARIDHRPAWTARGSLTPESVVEDAVSPRSYSRAPVILPNPIGQCPYSNPQFERNHRQIFHATQMLRNSSRRTVDEC